jgi:predicted adenine nucleotide alpha hydrolase (AANH) superfamily ATPase
MVEISKREEFYAQQYCGCIYSLRDTNKWRLAHGRDKVVIGQDYYGKEQGVVDATSAGDPTEAEEKE